ncbi:hypothetical protein IIA16_00845 [bacterium]|nr:hypothetical protein [bacterium]
MRMRFTASALLALLLGACAPAQEGNEATSAPLPTTTADAPAANGDDANGHEAKEGLIEGMGPWTVEDGDYAFVLAMMPTPPVAGTVTLTVTVTNSAGEPVDGLELGYEAYDEDAGQAVHSGTMESTSPGVHTVTLELGASDWRLTIHGEIDGVDHHGVFEAYLD